MYKLSLSQAPAEGITRDQLREQIRAQVQQATEEARASVRDAQAARAQAQAIGAPGQPDAPMAPVGVPTISVKGMPWEADIPPRVKDVSIAFFVMCAVIIVGFPIMRAIGKRIERGAGPAEMIDERAKGARTDILAANEAQPVEPLLVGQAHAFAGVCDPHALSALVPIRFSVPDSSRAIFARCVTKIRAVITVKSSAVCRLSSAHKIAGVAALASKAESEEYRVMAATMSQIAPKASAPSGAKARRMPM